MESKSIFGAISVLSILAILFMPTDSKYWIYLLIIGIIFGIAWLVKNK